MTLVAAPLSAVAASAVHHYMLGTDFIKVAVLWWSAEVVGELVVAPALLTAPSLVNWWSRANRRRRIEGAVGLAATVLFGVATFAMPANTDRWAWRLFRCRVLCWSSSGRASVPAPSGSPRCC